MLSMIHVGTKPEMITLMCVEFAFEMGIYRR
jgi:hypothetical protein